MDDVASPGTPTTIYILGRSIFQRSCFGQIRTTPGPTLVGKACRTNAAAVVGCVAVAPLEGTSFLHMYRRAHDKSESLCLNRAEERGVQDAPDRQVQSYHRVGPPTSRILNPSFEILYLFQGISPKHPPYRRRPCDSPTLRCKKKKKKRRQLLADYQHPIKCCCGG